MTVIGFQTQGCHRSRVDRPTVAAPQRIGRPTAVAALGRKQSTFECLVPLVPGVILQLMKRQRGIVPVIVVVFADARGLLQQIAFGLGDFVCGHSVADQQSSRQRFGGHGAAGSFARSIAGQSSLRSAANAAEESLHSRDRSLVDRDFGAMSGVQHHRLPTELTQVTWVSLGVTPTAGCGMLHPKGMAKRPAAPDRIAEGSRVIAAASQIASAAMPWL